MAIASISQDGLIVTSERNEETKENMTIFSRVELINLEKNEV